MKYLPNILTILRLLSCPLLIYLFYSKKYLIVLIIFVLACITDFFDGYLARQKNLKSNLGKILDPIADKALIITMCIMLIINENVEGLNKIALYIIILGETLGHLSCSIYNQVIENEKAGTLPPINLIKEKLIIFLYQLNTSI